MADDKIQGGQQGRSGTEKMGDDERRQREAQERGQRSESGTPANPVDEKGSTVRGDENAESGSQRPGQTGGQPSGQGKVGGDR